MKKLYTFPVRTKNAKYLLKKTFQHFFTTVLFVLLLCPVQKANATVRTFQFNGTTNAFDGSVAGDAMAATLVYDDASSPVSSGTGYAYYNFISFVITVGGNSDTATSGTIGVEIPPASESQFVVSANGGLYQLSLSHPASQVFASTALPGSLNLSDFTANDCYIAVADFSAGNYQYYAPVSSITDLTPANTTTMIASNNNPSFTAAPNNSVTFTATVTGSGTVNEGTVSFTGNGTIIPGGGAVPVSSGQASFTTTFTNEGSFNIKANYSGTTNFGTSSDSLTQTVNSHTTADRNTFCNSASSISALVTGIASPYPSEIFVSGLSGTISGVTVSINSFESDKPSSVELLLVGPENQTLVLLN